MNTSRTERSECTIRSAELDDVPAVLRLWREAEAEPSVGEDAVTVGELVARPDRPMLVAEDEKRIVGTVVACWDGWRGNLYRLAVAPSSQRRGIALRLVAEGERRLREHGARKIAAIVVSERPPAVGLWHAAGYEPDRRITRFVKTFEPDPSRP